MQKETQVYYCEGCGGIMQFDIPHQLFCCKNCGNEQKLEPEDNCVDEHDYAVFLQSPRDDEWEQKTEVRRCESCGAEIVVPLNATTIQCGFCGCDHVLHVRQGEGIRPEGIIPFRVDRHKVGELFRKWLKGKWFAPGTLKQLYQQDKLQAVYLPYWTYDADATGHYTGQGGEEYYVTVGSGDNKHQERRVRWYPVSGTVSNRFDDILVSGKNEQERHEKKASAFTTKECLPFDMAYLSGYQAHKYTLGVEEGFSQAKDIMHDYLTSMARDEILRRYDEAQVSSLNAHYSSVMFKHLLLPMWMSGYQYRGKLFHFCVNGQTGKVAGQYPKSKIRVGIAVVLGLALLVLLAMWIFKEA